jgi:hypothetical protein
MRRALCRILGVTLLFGIVLGSRPATAQPCPADYDGSGQVDEDDIYAFMEIWHDAVEADVNQDGQVTEDDVFAFLALYQAGLPGADINHDSVVSLDDLYYFLQAYARVTHSPSTDFDGDGHVTESGSEDSGDLFAFLDHWYRGC